MNSNRFLIALKGMAMGMAEIVPGVSGGTIAFISGIYEELINTIKAFDLGLMKAVFQGKWKSASRKANLIFLIPLLIGMLGGIVIGIFAIDYLIHAYPVMVWSFFVGLILASAYFIIRQVKQWNWLSITFLFLGILIAFLISNLPVSAVNISLPYLFLSGAVAICALILPGISGSFILLLLGVYVYITGAIKTFLTEVDFSLLVPIGVFALGCVVGLVVFSRIVSYTYQHFPNKTLMMLTGFIIGALYRIWPWRNPDVWLNNVGEEVLFQAKSIVGEDWHVLKEKNVWPNDYYQEPQIAGAIIAALLGFALIFLLTRIAPTSTES